MKKKPGQVSSALESALEAELAEIRRKHDDDVVEETPQPDKDGVAQPPLRKTVAKKGDYIYGIIERMRIYDRFLKLEQLKLKVDDPEWGSKFGSER